MQPRTPAHLWDALQAAKKAEQLVAAPMTTDQYLQDWIRQAAAERQLEIIGEALNRIRKHDLPTAERIPDLHAVIATRNIIAHRYDVVDHLRVWKLLREDIPALIVAISTLLGEFGPAH